MSSLNVHALSLPSRLFDVPPVDLPNRCEVVMMICLDTLWPRMMELNDQGLTAFFHQYASHYVFLTHAAMYDILLSPERAQKMHQNYSAINQDESRLMVQILVQISSDRNFRSIRPVVLQQILWLTSVLVKAKANVCPLIDILLGQIRMGVNHPCGLSLAHKMLELFNMDKTLVYSTPDILRKTFVIYTRLLLDHDRPDLAPLRFQEIVFCLEILQKRTFDLTNLLGNQLLFIVKLLSLAIPDFKTALQTIVTAPQLLDSRMNTSAIFQTPKIWTSPLPYDLQFTISQLFNVSLHTTSVDKAIRNYRAFFAKFGPITPEVSVDIVQFIMSLCGATESGMKEKLFWIGNLIESFGAATEIRERCLDVAVWHWVFWDPAGSFETTGGFFGTIVQTGNWKFFVDIIASLERISSKYLEGVGDDDCVKRFRAATLSRIRMGYVSVIQILGLPSVLLDSVPSESKDKVKPIEHIFRTLFEPLFDAAQAKHLTVIPWEAIAPEPIRTQKSGDANEELDDIDLASHMNLALDSGNMSDFSKLCGKAIDLYCNDNLHSKLLGTMFAPFFDSEQLDTIMETFLDSKTSHPLLTFFDVVVSKYQRPKKTEWAEKVLVLLRELREYHVAIGGWLLAAVLRRMDLTHSPSDDKSHVFQPLISFFLAYTEQLSASPHDVLFDHVKYLSEDFLPLFHAIVPLLYAHLKFIVVGQINILVLCLKRGNPRVTRALCDKGTEVLGAGLSGLEWVDAYLKWDSMMRVWFWEVVVVECRLRREAILQVFDAVSKSTEKFPKNDHPELISGLQSSLAASISKRMVGPLNPDDLALLEQLGSKLKAVPKEWGLQECIGIAL